MTKSSLAVIGKGRLADEFVALGREKGLEVAQPNDATAIAPTSQFVIDTENGSDDKKRAVLQRLDASLPASGIIVSSCLRFSTTLMASWVKKPERVVGLRPSIRERSQTRRARAGLTHVEKSVSKPISCLKTGKTVRVKDAPV
jgi:hypothetical protein